jgi:hypothetical protein
VAVLWNLRSCHPPPQPKRAPSPPASPAQAGPAREARPEVWGLRTRAAPRGRCGPRRHPAQAARRTSRSWKPEAQPARGGVGPRGAPTLDEAECFAHRSRRESASPRSILFVSLSRSRFGCFPSSVMKTHREIATTARKRRGNFPKQTDAFIPSRTHSRARRSCPTHVVVPTRRLRRRAIVLEHL